MAKIIRKTKETDITLELNIRGNGAYEINTGIGFFDHMLSQIAVHANVDLNVKCVGDLYVDSHHTIEDVGIALGLAIKESLKDVKGINRYGKAIIPMDESLILCAIDVCNRPYCEVDDAFTISKIGEFDTEMVSEFFKAVSYNSGLNIHIIKLRGINNHHICEGMFKAFARAFLDAITFSDVFKGETSSKGVLWELQ